MATEKKRYWVYVHDSDGDLVRDLGEYDSYRDALDAAGSDLQSAYINDRLTWNDTIRVVDNDLQDGTTIWLAGPVERPAEAI